eukprot:Nk52_evm12s268 gene=Nk52_evmTU12s268
MTLPEVIKFEDVKSLVVNERPVGKGIEVAFQCPLSPFTCSAVAGVEPGQARRFVDSGIRRLSHTSNSSRSKVKNLSDYSQSDRETACVNAFASVRHCFVWDEKRNGFISQSAAGQVMNSFYLQLQKVPVTTAYDQSILARMLVELAGVDGSISAEEKEFLTSFLPPHDNNVDVVLQKPVVSAVELNEVTPGEVRMTMIMLDWCLALTDRVLEYNEEQKINSHAVGLGLSPQASSQMKHYAQEFILENALDSLFPIYGQEGQLNAEGRQHFGALAQQIGVDVVEAETREVRYRKRVILK